MHGCLISLPDGRRPRTHPMADDLPLGPPSVSERHPAAERKVSLLRNLTNR